MIRQAGIDFDKSMFAGWANLASLDKVLVNIIAMNDLWAIAVQRDRKTGFRATMSGLKGLLGSLKEMTTCRLMTVKEGDETELQIEIK